MFRSGSVGNRGSFNVSSARRKALLASTFLFIAFVLCVLPAPERVSLAGGAPGAPTTGSVAGSANPVQTPAPCPTSTNRSVVGEFGPVIHLPLVPVHLSVLPDGRVLFWGRDKGIAPNGTVLEAAGKSEAYVWNMADGSNKTDAAVFRPSEGKWYIINSSTGASRITSWGINGDIPVPGDYDGDGRADLAVYRPSEANWYIINSSTGSGQFINFGVSTDRVAPGDYDGDGKVDIAVFRPSENNWYIRKSSDGSTQVTSLGFSVDTAVPGDYDGDRKTDVAGYRTTDGNWFIIYSSNGALRPLQFGTSGDVPVSGDYNGDGRTDPAVYRPSQGTWHIYNLATLSSQVINWGLPGDTVAPGDYDGDGKADAAIFRPSEGRWHIRNSSDGSSQIKTWGLSGDIVVPKDYDGMLRVANSTTNLFCSGHSFLPDGRLFVAGGHKSPDFDRAGEPHTNIFDYRTNRWSRGPDMNKGRWYPYNVTLNTGETVIMAGDYWSNFPTFPPTFATNMDPQVYTSGGGLRNLNQPVSLTFYPYLHLAPDGKVFQAQSGFTNPVDPQTLDRGSRLLDTDANQGFGSWTYLESTRFPHAMGTSVLFDSGRKVLVVGGFTDTRTPTREAEFMNLKPASGLPTWTPVASMNSPRTYHTATILPNGKVLVTGGVTCQGGNNVDCATAAAMTPEMWDPMANPGDPAQIPWCKMAAQKEFRAYHSVAALLPDGRVLVGGGGLPGAVGEIDANGKRINRGDEPHARLFGHKNVEIFSPPYLFDSSGNPAVRPSITSAPTNISYGQTFFVGTSNAGTAPNVSLVRLASVTHGFNQDQRHVFLNATLSTSGLNVTAPADSNKCPPGYYMLFVLNSNGVPSVSRIVRVLNTPVYEGYVDGSDCSQIWGWAWDRSKPNKPINVDIYDGSTYIATVPANRFRQDLLNADKGNGVHAFVFNVPQSLKNGLMHSITVRFGGTSSSLALSPRSIVCSASLFLPDVPQTTASGGGSTWEQGIEFSSSVSGKITHVRYWRGSGEIGSHVGRIWTATGILLATVPFTNESLSGWQEAALPTPLQITAGVRYKVTYNVNSLVAKTFNTLSSPITRGPLTGWGSSFSTPAGTFPTTGSTSNFFADIKFNSPQ